MADIKISELGAASAVNATDLFPATSGGVTLKITAQQLKNYMGVGNLTDLTTDNKTSAVAAISEVDGHADTAQSTANNAQQMIAPIQNNLTAIKAYAVGEQFVYNGILYEAIAAIAQGATITIGGNCSLAYKVTEQIKFLRDDISGICKVKKETIHWDSVVAGTVYTVAYLDSIIPRGSLRGLVIINCAGYSAYDVNGELYYVETDAIQYGGTVYYKPSISQNDVTLNCSILYSD